MRTLYGFFRSSTSYRLRIALALKGLDWDPEYVSLPRMEQRSAGFLATNPQGLVPVLVDDGAVFTQSLAIMEYLEERYPEPALLPGDIVERAYVRALCQVIGCDIHPLNNVRVLKYLESRFGLSEADRQDWYAHWIAQGLAGFEAMLVREGRAGLYCLGDIVTMADVCLLPQIANARRFACDLVDYPLSVAIADRLAERSEVAAVHPSTQADAF